MSSGDQEREEEEGAGEEGEWEQVGPKNKSAITRQVRRGESRWHSPKQPAIDKDFLWGVSGLCGVYRRNPNREWNITLYVDIAISIRIFLLGRARIFLLIIQPLPLVNIL